MNQKKTYRHPKADEEKREQHRAIIESLKDEGHPIVPNDESGFALDVSRDYGY